MDSNAYNLDKLVEVLRPDWPLVSKRTIHFYASKGIIERRRRGRGAEYNDLDRLRLIAAIRMRDSGEKLKDVAARIRGMNIEAIEKYLREPWSPRPVVRSISSYLREGPNNRDPIYRDENIAKKEEKPETWSRIALGEGIELAIRADVQLRRHLPAIMAALNDLANER
ncbi:MAG: MerR family transcriptional regulator [Terriglobales bacterium]